MFTKSDAILLSIVKTVVCFNSGYSQEENKKIDKSINNKFAFFNNGGSHTIDLVTGSALLDGDYNDWEYEVHFRIGYKCHLTSHLSISFSYNKCNLAVEELYFEGFMSFDLN